ncbi:MULTISPECIES: hypothetical protein [unclassified Rubrivivax]|nr:MULTISPECIES: hypothetical protein [unclassified Rubrivivax]MCC9596822.1 hypothetical protein [Rubrivivax sp. JA1055]MCC9648979.1 hypothetical protein [Rubrivivax sp. JA1029]
MACLLAAAASAAEPSSSAPPAPTAKKTATKAAPPARAFDTRHVAPGFAGLKAQDRVAVMPPDIELFSLSAGGVSEPRADWTMAAREHMKAALAQRTRTLGLAADFFDERQADEFAEPIGLQNAVASAIWVHHAGQRTLPLPTKHDKLDWSLGDSVRPIAQQGGQRYGLFVFVRDSYASAERKAAMIGLALFGFALMPGAQVGYASLVDLESGQVVWFNPLVRMTGDLREIDSATETVAELLGNLPVAP